MAKLILIRHGRSEWNDLGLWTGWNDIPLNDTGRAEARRAATEMRDIQIDKAYVSDLSRAQETLEIIKKELNLTNIPTVVSPAIKERSYGDLAGKNKWKVKEEFGDDQFLKWRRSWDYPIPNGETLKNVYERVVPYFEKEILPELKAGKNILVSAHGNSLRAFIKHLEKISEDLITSLEVGTGEVYIYTIDEQGNVTDKEIRATNEAKHNV
ncbi:MAG: 2,3-bisphosphoglycerate-dependent phosphoglycerate mutase [Weeksellaceae bacterium]